MLKVQAGEKKFDVGRVSLSTTTLSVTAMTGNKTSYPIASTSILRYLGKDGEWHMRTGSSLIFVWKALPDDAWRYGSAKFVGDADDPDSGDGHWELIYWLDVFDNYQL